MTQPIPTPLSLPQALLLLTKAQLTLLHHLYLAGIALQQEQYCIIAVRLSSVQRTGDAYYDERPERTNFMVANEAYFINPDGKTGERIRSQSFRLNSQTGFWEWIPLA